MLFVPLHLLRRLRTRLKGIDHLGYARCHWSYTKWGTAASMISLAPVHVRRRGVGSRTGPRIDQPLEKEQPTECHRKIMIQQG